MIGVNKLSTLLEYLFLNFPPFPCHKASGFKICSLFLFFFRIQESCLILKMPVGDAFLLKELLTRDDAGVSFRLSYAETSEKMKALREHGIYNLSVQDALFVFDRRLTTSL